MSRIFGRTLVSAVEVEGDVTPAAKMENRELDGIRQLLSHLHGEITELSLSYTEVLRVLQRFEELCSRDQMTQLLNREAFFRKWSDLLQACLHSCEKMGVIALDIDHFKSINDTHGHAIGDEVICRVGGLLREFESTTRIAARFGGEEFVIGVCARNSSEVFQLAEELRMKVQSSSGSGPSCTVSVGVSFDSSERDDSRRSEREVAEELIQRADQALYSAKRLGRNRVQAA
jgi:diguanylate cyclase (GGDEF)-like protein